MTIYLIPTGETWLDAKQRACGWQQPRLTSRGRNQLEKTAQRLAEFKPAAVLASDLHGQHSHMVGRTLRIPVEGTKALRGFNVGRHHGRRLVIVEEVLAELAPQWENKPDVPICEGDSWTSYTRRIRHVPEYLHSLKYTGNSIVLILSPRDMAGFKASLNGGLKPADILAASIAHIRPDSIFVIRGL